MKWDQARIEEGAAGPGGCDQCGHRQRLHRAGGHGLLQPDGRRQRPRRWGIPKESVLVASTGVIGMQLPMDRIAAGVAAMAPKLEEGLAGGEAASKAIMTTDTKNKEAAVQVEIGGATVTIGGMCKGSGMIHPNMCTMLSFVDDGRGHQPGSAPCGPAGGYQRHPTI